MSHMPEIVIKCGSVSIPRSSSCLYNIPAFLNVCDDRPRVQLDAIHTQPTPQSIRITLDWKMQTAYTEYRFVSEIENCSSAETSHHMCINCSPGYPATVYMHNYLVH